MVDAPPSLLEATGEKEEPDAERWMGRRWSSESVKEGDAAAGRATARVALGRGMWATGS